MKRPFLRKYMIGTLTSLIATTTLQAQIQDSAAVSTPQLNLYKASNLWLKTFNSAGLNDSETLNYSDVSASYKYSKGDFRFQQEGKRNNGFAFNAEGATKLKDAYLWGKFSIETEKKRDARFNASIIDPFRGMPFIIADATPSDWRLQYYNLETKVSTPKLFNQIYFGLGIEYSVSTGAKQLDPRPENRYYSINLAPSAVWTINDEHSLGGTFHFTNMNERSNVNIKNNQFFVTAYKLEGLGAFVESTNGTGYNREYKGSSYGGELVYSIKKKSFNTLLSVGYIYDYEDVIDGLNQLINTSKALRDHYFGDLSFKFTNERQMHIFSIDARYRNINGVFYEKDKDPNDPVNQLILYEKTRSKFRNANFALNYDYFQLKNKGYSWTIGTTIRYQKQNDKYLLPTQGVESSYQDFRRYDFDLHGQYNVDSKLPFNGELLIGSSVLYSLAQDAELYYGGTRNEHIVVTDLLERDFSFLSKNYWKFGGNIQYSVPLNISSKRINAYGKVDAYFIPKTSFGRRSNINLSIGFIL